MPAEVRAISPESCESALLETLAKKPTSIIVSWRRENPDDTVSWGCESYAAIHEWPMLIALLERRFRIKLDVGFVDDGRDW